MDTLTAKTQVIEASLELVEKGLVARTWGNVSARISEDEFVITPSGMAYEDLTPDDIVTVRIDGLSYEGDIKPSSEKGVHAAAYALRPEINFIVHTHQDYATALSALGRGIRGYAASYADVIGRAVPCAEYGLSSTKKLADNVAACVGMYADSKAFLMTNHGTVCLGEDRDDAMKVALTLEDMCKERYAEIAGRSFDRELPEFYETKESPEGTYIFVKSPQVRLMSQAGDQRRVYVDDEAQFLGSGIRCVSADRSTSSVMAAARRYGAVFVKGRGALVYGPDAEEANALRMIVEKGALASYVAAKSHDAHAVPVTSSVLEHIIYKVSYSKRKDA
ncbi:MAG: class II aldolase/adducin family protein [Eubacterium sp.]|nr:class II aldolase/adducin family protein [Eubacterium sp.]